MRPFLLLLVLCLCTPALAQNRLALVIGNDAYANVPVLEKAVADAEAIAATLGAQGYEVVAATDATRRGMNRSISDFTGRLQPGDSAVVFFAGHGVEIDGENYLLPTDIVAPASGESDFVKSESIALSALLDRVRGTGARMAIVIVDACRNNPFEISTGRSIGGTRGLGRIAAPQGTFVIFSAGAGQAALDRLDEADAAQNSVFTRALLPRLSEPGLELRDLVSDLRVEVRDMARGVKHSQVPAYYDELLGEFYFTPAALKQVPTPEVSAPRPASASDDMRADLALAREIGTAAALDAFLDRYADQDDAYAYQLAVQLRQGLGEGADATPADRAAAKPSEPAATEVAAKPAAKSTEPDRRETLRRTQVALNAVGCSAGAADGIAGPRTRRAFAGFLSASGANLDAADLGSEAALRTVEAAPGMVCKPTPTAAAAPSSSGGTTAAKPASAPPAPTLVGSWSFSAKCALGVRVTGTVSYRKAGTNFYQGNLRDSLGQSANTEVYLSGRNISGKAYFPGQTNTFSGRLSPDGNSYTTAGTSTCKVYAQRN